MADQKSGLILVMLGLFYLMSLFAVLICHELGHWLTAKLLGYKARIEWLHPFAARVSYGNRGNDLHNLLIAGLTPLLLSVIGWQIPLSMPLAVLKFSLLINVFNLLPLTADGEVIFLSLMSYYKKKRAQHEK